jgi:polyhydroxyalkanoic acid synthase PhaR subunit
MTDKGAASGGIPDPMAFWREMYRQTEATWGKALEQNMAGESYAAMLGQTLDSYLTFQQALRENMDRYLEAFGLPRREDLARLGGQVVALEAKIDDLDDRLEAVQRALDEQNGLLRELRSAQAKPRSSPARSKSRARKGA